MITHNVLIFDENVCLAAGATSTVTTTSEKHSKLLTLGDRVTYTYEVNTIGYATSVGFSLVGELQVSADGRTWVDKYASMAQLVITVLGSEIAPLIPRWFVCSGDPGGANPCFAYTRIQLTLTSTLAAAFRLQIHASTRTRTKRARSARPASPLTARPIVSPEALQEVYGLAVGAAHLPASDRAAHVLDNLSPQARGEIARYQAALANMHPAVKASVAQVARGLANLMDDSRLADGGLEAVAAAFGGPRSGIRS